MKTRTQNLLLAQVNKILLGLVLAGAGHWATLPLHASDRQWTGFGGNALWSNPNNWTPVGAPQNGESLDFYPIGPSIGIMNNDLVGLHVGKLFFYEGTWLLAGNDLTLDDNLQAGALNINSQLVELTVGCRLILGNNIDVVISWGSPGVIFNDPNHVYFTGDIDLNGHNLHLSLESQPDIHPTVSFTGQIVGNGNLRLFTAFLDGIAEIGGTQPNTFTGTLECHGGVTLNKLNGPAVNTQLDVSGPVWIKRSGQIASGATVRIAPSGQLRLEGHDETITDLDIGSFRIFGYNDPAVVVDMQGATLTVLGDISSTPFSPSLGSGFVTPILQGRIALPNGSHIVDAHGSQFYGLDLQAQLVGGGGFSKFGNAALLLKGSNSFTGNLSVNAGILEVRNNNALGSTAGSTTLSGGSMTLRDATIAGETLLARGTQALTVDTAGSLLFTIGTCVWSGPIVLDTNLVIQADNTYLTGQISGPGGLDFRGAYADLAGPAANTFTGLTRVAASLVEFNKPPAVAAVSGPLLVGTGFGGGPFEARWWNNFQGSTPNVTVYSDGLVNLNNYNENFGALNFHGGDVETGTGLLSLFQTVTTFPVNSTAVLNGKVRISTGNQTFDVADGTANPDLTVNAIISDSSTASITKQGLGELSLTGVNTYRGSTFIQTGLVVTTSDFAFGTTTFGTTVSDGATLELDGLSQVFIELLNLRGSGRGGTNGALYCRQGSTIGSFILLAAPATIRCDDASGQFFLVSTITGTGPLTKTGVGTLTLGGSQNNTYTGDMFANQGALYLSKPNGITAIPGSLTIGTFSGFDGGTAASAAHFQNDAIAGTNVTVNGGSTYNLNHLNETLVGVVLNNGGRLQTGNGTLSLVGGSGPRVAVNPGFDGASVISGRLFLDSGGTFTVGPRLGIFFNPAPELDVTATVSGGGDIFAVSLTKNGAGQMRLGAANTFSSRLDVNQGALIVANAGALGSTTKATVVNNGGTLVLDGGGLLINNESLVLNSSNSAALNCRSGSNTWTGPLTLSQTAGINVAPASGYLQALNTVSGAGGLTKRGPGTIQFWGFTENTFAGLTTVAAGTLEGGRVNLISIPGDAVIGDDSTTNLTATLRSLREQQLAPTGTVTVASSGVLDLFKFPTLAGPVQQLRALNGRGQVKLGDTSSLTISNDVACEFFGPMTGLGTFTKLGPASLKRPMKTWGDWTFSGVTSISGGDFLFHGTSHNSVFLLHNGGHLRGDGRIFNTVTADAGSLISADSKFPDHQGGDLEMNALTLAADSIVELNFYGPSATGGNGNLIVDGPVQLNNAGLTGGFQYPPREADVITLLRKTTSGAIGGTFTGWPQGIVRKFGDITVVGTYTGGDGNDFTLTVTNLALAYSGYRLADGNGTQTIEPNECNLLYVTLLNRRTNNLVITNAVLRATTSNAVVTIPSATFPTMLAGLTTANITPFQFRTDTHLPCGSSVSFELVLGVLNEGEFAVTFTPIGGVDCANPTGPCESCTVVSGQFTTNTPITLQPLYFVGAPSICYPPKACPGVDLATNLPPVRYLTHSFTNSATNELCLTALLRFDCPTAPTNALAAAAYLTSFSPSQPGTDYLGDSGQGGPPYPAFSFSVPAGSNFVMVVMARATNLVCNNYTLELFGLPCPPPTLAVAREAAPSKVRVHWSTAYPGWTPQQAVRPDGTFSNSPLVPTVVNGRYALTNVTATTNQFFRLRK